MDRRDFLKASAASVAAPAIGLGCSTPADREHARKHAYSNTYWGWDPTDVVYKSWGIIPPSGEANHLVWLSGKPLESNRWDGLQLHPTKVVYQDFDATYEWDEEDIEKASAEELIFFQWLALYGATLVRNDANMWCLAEYLHRRLGIQNMMADLPDAEDIIKFRQQQEAVYTLRQLLDQPRWEQDLDDLRRTVDLSFLKDPNQPIVTNYPMQWLDVDPEGPPVAHLDDPPTIFLSTGPTADGKVWTAGHKLGPSSSVFGAVIRWTPQTPNTMPGTSLPATHDRYHWNFRVHRRWVEPLDSKMTEFRTDILTLKNQMFGIREALEKLKARQ